MFGNNNKYVVFFDGKEGDGPGLLFFEGGLYNAKGAIEINRDSVEFSCVYKTISKVKMFE